MTEWMNAIENGQFTIKKASNVRENDLKNLLIPVPPGTFAGFCEKIPYMKELGVNTVLFLPLYDFNERMYADEKKINYWG